MPINADFINRQNSVVQSLFNILFKQAFRQTHLKQIGRDPRFFDYERPIRDENLTRMKLQVLHGFKASVFMSELGVTVAVDTLFRFMSTITCLDKINDLRRHARDDGHFKKLVEEEVVGTSVIADWGNKRVYIVSGIDFKVNPVSKKFVYNNSEISVAQYMNDVYGKQIKDFNQPLLMVKHGEDFIHLPPEFCRIDGVPDSIRASPGMRDCLAICRTTPEKKMQEIKQMMATLMQQ